eukprot:5549535-Prymnesium_polylepis.1
MAHAAAGEVAAARGGGGGGAARECGAAAEAAEAAAMSPGAQVGQMGSVRASVEQLRRSRLACAALASLAGGNAACRRAVGAEEVLWALVGAMSSAMDDAQVRRTGITKPK